MLVTDEEEFLKVLNGLAAMKKLELNAPAIELWWLSFQSWEIADFKIAAAQLIKTCKWIGPNDFENLRKAGRETPAEAWVAARKFLRWGLHGYTLDENCPPKIATCIRALGGANVIAMTDEDKLPFLERRFTEHYETLEDADDVRRSEFGPMIESDRQRYQNALTRKPS